MTAEKKFAPFVSSWGQKLRYCPTQLYNDFSCSACIDFFCADMVLHSVVVICEMH